MSRGPVARAGFLVAALIPGVAAVEVLLLERGGVVLDAKTLVVAVILPTAAMAFVAVAAIAIVTGRRAIVLRDAMRRFARGDLSQGTLSRKVAAERDLIGVLDALETMRHELDRAMRRLADVDAQRRRLFADLAHELATPASALLALHDTLAERDAPLAAAERARLFDALETQTLRLAHLVEDVRDLAELDDPDVSFDREAHDLAPIVARAVEAAAVGPGPKVETALAPISADVDAMRIEQVIANLIGNARRHTPAERKVRVSLEASGDTAVIAVDDEGPGVPAAQLNQLGERLFRVDAGRDRRRGGHGLGLSIVRAIAARHDGHVRFEPSPLGGLRVVVRIARRAPG